jgi:membrane-associated phospholipid phosphatase
VAGSIALSRILLGAHHPSDVVTATFIALAVAWMVWGFVGRNGRVDRYVSDPCTRRSPVQE